MKRSYTQLREDLNANRADVATSKPPISMSCLPLEEQTILPFTGVRTIALNLLGNLSLAFQRLHK